MCLFKCVLQFPTPETVQQIHRLAFSNTIMTIQAVYLTGFTRSGDHWDDIWRLLLCIDIIYRICQCLWFWFLPYVSYFHNLLFPRQYRQETAQGRMGGSTQVFIKPENSQLPIEYVFMKPEKSQLPVESVYCEWKLMNEENENIAQQQFEVAEQEFGCCYHCEKLGALMEEARRPLQDDPEQSYIRTFVTCFLIPCEPP